MRINVRNTKTGEIKTVHTNNEFWLSSEIAIRWAPYMAARKTVLERHALEDTDETEIKISDNESFADEIKREEKDWEFAGVEKYETVADAVHSGVPKTYCLHFCVYTRENGAYFPVSVCGYEEALEFAKHNSAMYFAPLGVSGELTSSFPALISVYSENDGYIYPWGAANTREAAFAMIRKYNDGYDQFYNDDLCPFVTVCESLTYARWKQETENGCDEIRDIT